MPVLVMIPACTCVLETILGKGPWMLFPLTLGKKRKMGRVKVAVETRRLWKVLLRGLLRVTFKILPSAFFPFLACREHYSITRSDLKGLHSDDR